MLVRWYRIEHDGCPEPGTGVHEGITEVLEGDRVAVLDVVVREGGAGLEHGLVEGQALAVLVELRELVGDRGLDIVDADVGRAALKVEGDGELARLCRSGGDDELHVGEEEGGERRGEERRERERERRRSVQDPEKESQRLNLHEIERRKVLGRGHN